nr:hypothetical protein [Actinomycetota bacterium]
MTVPELSVVVDEPDGAGAPATCTLRPSPAFTRALIQVRARIVQTAGFV